MTQMGNCLKVRKTLARLGVAMSRHIEYHGTFPSTKYNIANVVVLRETRDGGLADLYFAEITGHKDRR